MIFWINGDLARQITSWTNAQIIADLTANLANFFNPVPVIQNVYLTKWMSDPYVRGSFSYAKVGTTSSHFRALAQVLTVGKKNIWFIGEGTNSVDYSYTNGAFDSGTKAAAAALKVVV